MNIQTVRILLLCLLLAANGYAQAATFEDRLVEANRHLREGNLPAALAATQAAAKLDDQRFEAPAAAALILLGAGRLAEARQAADQAVQIAPPDKREQAEQIARLVAEKSAAVGETTPATTDKLSPAESRQLPPAARRQYDMLLLMVEEADQAKLDAERKQLLREFLDKSESFVKEQPAQMTVWTLRAVAGLELNQARTAWEAGRQLTRLGADNSDDPKLRRVMAMLERRGWLGDELPPAPETATRERPFENSLGMKFVPVPGTDALFSVWETRKGDYAAYARANPGVDGSWQNAKFLEVPVSPTDDHPVVNVSWHDARAFCEWLTRKERAEGRLGAQRFYRLPTDAEWSLAVGLANETGASPKDKDIKIKDVYPWGRQWPPPAGAGNYADQTAKQRFSGWTVIEGYRDGFATTAPVGSFAANQFGLRDLGGNVWEFCEDQYSHDVQNPVTRGGGWSSSDRHRLLSSIRFNHPILLGPSSRDHETGFRVVLVGAPDR